MNRFPSVLCFVAAVALSATALTAQQPRPRTSPHETFSAFFGDSANRSLVTITYGRPYTKDPKTGEPRKIWGGLVPWDKAYRLGADEATLLLTGRPLAIGETVIPAGAYTLYLVP